MTIEKSVKIYIIRVQRKATHVQFVIGGDNASKGDKRKIEEERKKDTNIKCVLFIQYHIYIMCDRCALRSIIS